MSPSLQTLEKKVSSLSPTELEEFSSWFATFYNDQWDQQIQSDSTGGKLNALAADALAAFKKGKCTDL